MPDEFEAGKKACDAAYRLIVIEGTGVKRSIWRPVKDEVVSEFGAVVTSHPLASEVGVQTLTEGGNAVDAAVAMGFCLAVVEPWASSIAGHGQMLIHMAEQQSSLALDFSHRAPTAATPEMYRVVGRTREVIGLFEVENRANVSGYEAIGVPGVTAGLCRAHQLYGSLPLQRLLEPAIHYAEKGFVANWLTTQQIAEVMGDFVKYRVPARIFLRNGYPPVSGVDRVIQADLGQVLRLIARQGARGLYRGELPHTVEADMKKNGGLLRAEDFGRYEVVATEPVTIRYRNYEILGMPGPSGCTTTLQALKILEHFDLAELGQNSAEYLHLVIESTRHAFADRYRFLGDPDFVPVPEKALLSTDYGRDIARLIDPAKTAFAQPSDQPWVRFAATALHRPWRYQKGAPILEDPSPSPPQDDQCTTHFSAIDRQRNMVSCTQTAVSRFGSRVITSGTGLLFSSGMVVFNPVPGSANSIAGFKRGLNNMAPLLMLNERKPFASLGAVGGRRIISCNTQIVLNLVDRQMSLQQAIAAPRVDASEAVTLADLRLDSECREGLARIGHEVEVVEESPSLDSGFAKPLGIMVDPATNRIRTGVDVFRISEARGI